MKPSNIIVAIAILVIGVVIGAYFGMQPQFAAQRWFIAGAMVLLVVIVVGFVVLLNRREERRRRLIRRVYLSPDAIYSSEYGLGARSQLVPGDRVDEFVFYVADMLSTLSYDYEITPHPDDFLPTYLLDTRTFRSHRDPSRGLVVDAWAGDLLRYEGEGDGRHTVVVASFDGQPSLERVLVSDGVFR